MLIELPFRLLNRASAKVLRSLVNHILVHANDSPRSDFQWWCCQPARVVRADHPDLYHHVFFALPASNAAAKRTDAAGLDVKNRRSGRYCLWNSRADFERERNNRDREGGRQRENRNGKIGSDKCGKDGRDVMNKRAGCCGVAQPSWLCPCNQHPQIHCLQNDPTHRLGACATR